MVEYCSSGGEMEDGGWRAGGEVGGGGVRRGGVWPKGKKKKKSLCSQRNELDDLRGRGEDRHSLPLTIKIRLASTVSTLASVKA